MSALRGERRRKLPRGVFERPKGTGQLWIRYHDRAGQEHREKLGLVTPTLAREKYEQRKTEIRLGKFDPDAIRRRRDDVMLGDVIDDYVSRRRGKVRNIEDLERYGECWKAALGKKTLRQIRPADVERYAADRRETTRLAGKKVSDQTLRHELGFLRTVYKDAIDNKLVDDNPAKIALRNEPKLRNKRTRVLSLEEETRLCSELSRDDYDHVVFAIHTGLRQGNHFGLERDWLSLTEGLVDIPADRSKGGDPLRVFLSETAKEILRRQPHRLHCKWVFPNEQGTNHLDAHNWVRRTFKPALERAGIKEFRWHDLRHTYTTRLAECGVRIEVIQELIGHADIETTQRYENLAESYKLDAVRRLDAYGIQGATGTGTGTESNAEKA